MTSDLHHLAAAYSLDCLDAIERSDFEVHHPGCEICSREVREFQETVAWLAEGIDVEPPPDLRELVLKDVAKTTQVVSTDAGIAGASETSERHRVVRALLMVAAAVVGIIGLFSFAYRRSGTDEFVALLEASDAIVTPLEGDSGTIQVIWSAERDEIAVIGSGLKSLDPGQVYELWLLSEEGAVKALLFSPSDNGDVRELLTVPDIGTTGWGVTLEPTGGSNQPTTEPIFVGSI